MSKQERQVLHNTLDGQDIARIELTHGQWAIVEAADWQRVYAAFGGNWSATTAGKRYTAGKSVRVLSGGQTRMSLARAIMQPAPGQTAKVAGDDPLDFRRDNLAVVGTSRLKPDVLAIPKAWATDDEKARAKELLPEPKPRQGHNPAIAAPGGTTQYVDRTPPVRQRPVRIRRLAAQLSDARSAARMIPDVRQTAAQRARGYLTRTEMRHIWLVTALRRAEGLELGTRTAQSGAGSMAKAMREGVTVKPRASAMATT